MRDEHDVAAIRRLLDQILWRASEFAEFRRTPNTLAYSVANEGVLLRDS